MRCPCYCGPVDGSLVKKEKQMGGEKPEETNDSNGESQLTDRVTQFLDAEGERIRQETEKIQSPIIAKARQEYKQRLSAFLEEERKKIKGDAENEAAAIRSRAQSEAEAIISQARVKDQEIRAEAQRQAEKVIEEAIKECNADRDRVLAEGQRQAAVIIEEARQKAAKLTGEAAEYARKTADAEREKVLAEARAKAHDESQSIVSNSWQRAQQMLDSAETAYKLVRTQLQDCVKAIIAADSKMEMVVAAGADHGHEKKSGAKGQDLELVVD
jgi:colicin import membrane protein